ncbi:MAG: peptidoglycan-associated lipoprotein Pal [Acidobacteriaceae bacterium]|nr:peptidoglycan-associated lipoprotein Pal [Acidobacteriaceae bacterium]
MSLLRLLQVPVSAATRDFALALMFSTVLILSGCGGHKTEVNAVPAAPAPTPPVASIEASPATVIAGEKIELTWKTLNATQVRIEPLGVAEANGSMTLAPTDSTSYRLIATGPGGTQESVATVTVEPLALNPAKAEEFFAKQGGRQDVFFDMDEYSVRADQQSTISNDVKLLHEHPYLRVLIEGHCDESGSAEYNLALGESRATAVKEMLVSAGIEAARIETITYGKERPFCKESSDQCWKQNRRAHIVPLVEKASIE